MLQVYDQILHYCNSVLEEPKTHVTKTDFVVCLTVLVHLLFCLAVILCMCAAISLFFLYGPRRPATVANARPVLQALLEVVTPTQSIWPSQYASLAYRAAVFSSVTSKKTTIWIPLSTLYDDILSERLELRNPRDTLPLLLNNTLSVHGVDIRLDVDLHWNLVVRLLSVALSPIEGLSRVIVSNHNVPCLSSALLMSLQPSLQGKSVTLCRLYPSPVFSCRFGRN